MMTKEMERSWAEDHKLWSFKDWSRVLSADETDIYLNGEPCAKHSCVSHFSY